MMNYIPRELLLSHDEQKAVYQTIHSVKHAIENLLPLCISYAGEEDVRIILPHSLFLQEKTPGNVTKVGKPHSFPTTMTYYNNWAQPAIGADVYQIVSTDSESKEGWRTLHLHNIQILSHEEVLNRAKKLTPESALRLPTNNEIDDEVHLVKGFIPRPDFIGNWEPWYRKYLTQAPFQHSMLARHK